MLAKPVTDHHLQLAPTHAVERVGCFGLRHVDSRALLVFLRLAAARRLGVPLSVIRSSPAGDCARYESPLVLVRPDHFVAWCGGGDAGVESVPVLQRAIGAWEAPTVD